MKQLIKLPLVPYIFMAALGIISWYYYYTNNLTLSYNDARSHLNIARRVIDSLHPGFAQIGSVWLPLQHILEIPTIWNDFMYRSGLSGSIISIISFVGSTILIGKITRAINLDYKASLVAMIIFALNPNILFMESTPMTELLMLFTSLGAIYFLIKWVGSNKIYDLTFSGIFTLTAVLTRYDGWFLFGFMSVAISLISLIKTNRKKAESNMILYSVFGLFGVGLWIGWNWLIFGDPLFFLNGPFSAKAQQNLLLKEGRLFTFHNLPLSIHTYSLAIIDNVSIILFILGLIGLLIGFLSKNSIAIKIALLSLLVPILFNIVSLYLGESVIDIPQLPPYSWFNIRYGLMALPAIAIGIAFIANKRMIATITIIAVILMQYYLMFATNNIITIQDGVRGSSGYFLDDVGNWLHNHADHGYILVASSSHDAL